MSDYFDRIEQQLVARVAGGVPRRGPAAVRRLRPGVHLRGDMLAAAAAVLVVLVVATAFLTLHHSSAPSRPAVGQGRGSADAVHLRPQGSPGAAALRRTAALIRRRAELALPGHHVTVRVTGGELSLAAAGVPFDTLDTLATPGRLAVYDWEADALTADGRTVASQLRTRDPVALTISQGADMGPGGGAGATDLYTALKRAATVAHPPIGPFNSRATVEYWAFAASDSHFCRELGVSPAVRCPIAAPAPTRAALREELAGVRVAARWVLRVPRGVVVLSSTGPADRYYVLLDRMALDGRQLSDPRAGTASSGEPDVTFGFTRRGQTLFGDLTAQIAHRGQVDSAHGHTLEQHFAIAIDGRLLTVPYIAQSQYPQGISGSSGSEIDGPFDREQARLIAAVLRYGPLPVTFPLAEFIPPAW